MKIKTILLIGLSTVAYAENKVIIQNSEVTGWNGQPDVEVNLDPNSPPMISNSDGNIYVVPNEIFTVNQTEIKPPVISMFITGNGTSVANISGRVSNSPTSCQRVTTNWTPIFSGTDYIFNETVSIPNTELNYTFSMSCTNSLNQTDNASVTYYGTSSGSQTGGDVSITNFNVQYLSTNQYRVSYTANNATSCKGLSSTNDGWRNNTNNPATVNITSSASWGLECEGQNGPVSINANFNSTQYDVTYQTQGPANCASVQTPPGYTRENYVFGSTIFDTSSSFPASAGKQALLNVVLGTYATIEFTYNRSSYDPEGDITWSSLQPSLEPDVGLPDKTRMTVTECPGDLMLNSSTVNAHCAANIFDGTGDVRMTHLTGLSRCQLVEGQKYYLNIIQTHDPGNVQDSCATIRAGGCGPLLRTRHN